MQTQLAPEYQGRAEAREAEAILRKCVHCGFCAATCPTYQLLGDELDSPRGRIYLIKQVLEGHAPTRKTQLHLDRCLTCRNCETTCPSGVQYGHLVDIGRHLVDERVPRPAGERAVRWLLKEGLPSPAFGPAMKLGQALRPLLPDGLKAKVPPPKDPGPWPDPVAQPAGDAQASTPADAAEAAVPVAVRRVLMLEGCVQPSMAGHINHATARVLHAAGIDVVRESGAGCCGAVKFHLNDQSGGLAHMRANIDAWWPHIEPEAHTGGTKAERQNPVDAIVINASGCGVTVKEYGHHLRHDPAYAHKAARVSELARDLSELLPAMLPRLRERIAQRAGAAASPTAAPGALGLLAYHPPCTLQHGMKLRGGVEGSLRELGFDVQVARNESHLCCGSAGTYSVLQPELSGQLRDRKLGHLSELKPRAILSANIGCITHLQSGSDVPVRHWVEVVDEVVG